MRVRTLIVSLTCVAAITGGLVGCGDQATPSAADDTSTRTFAPQQGGAGSSPSLGVSVVPAGPSGGHLGDPNADPDAPYAWINGPYVTRIGKPVEIDGSGSYARDGVLVAYRWDLDGDGDIDQTTAEPIIEHRFMAPFSGRIMLTVVDSSGRTQNASTHLAVTGDGDEASSVQDNCPDVDNPDQTDTDDDGLGDECDPTPGWPTNDAPGVQEGSG